MDATPDLAPAGDGGRRGAFPRTLTTLHWPRRPAWLAVTTALERGRLGPTAILRRLAGASGYDAVVVDGATGGAVRAADLGGAALLARRRSGPTVIVTDATWGRGRNAVERAARRVALRAFEGPRTVYCVLSRDELRTFPATWRVDPGRVEYTAFYATLADEELARPTGDDGGVFAGGDSLRDYRPLVAAAAGLRAPVRLATRRLDGARGLPPNVEAGLVPHADFMAAMRAASVVVVPLAPSRTRSAGQQTYLNAMALGKLVVVPDVLGVRDYVRHGETGLLVPPGDADALRRTLRWALAPESRTAVRELGLAARHEVRSRFTADHYVARVMDVVARRARRRAPLPTGAQTPHLGGMADHPARRGTEGTDDPRARREAEERRVPAGPIPQRSGEARIGNGAADPPAFPPRR